MKRSLHKKRPTQADVARLARVSQATVSYVLNESGAISMPEETRQRVQDAISALGYVPNTTARSLRTRKTFTIAAVIPDITNPYYPAFARGMQDICEQHGYDLVLYNTDGSAEKEQKCLRALRRGHVDGVAMVVFHLSSQELLALGELGLGVALLAGGRAHAMSCGLDSVYVDTTAASRRAVSYLIERGHTRIGMIAGLHDTPPRAMRIEGYRHALAEAGLPLDTALIRDGDFSEQSGYQAAQELLALAALPTAIFASNDLMAVGALRALREAGLRVPQDLALVGFDDIPAARLLSPPLTTVTQFEERLGRRLAELLLERLEGRAPEGARYEELPYQLIIRESA
jgi:LacI family transcriptional regulator